MKKRYLMIGLPAAGIAAGGLLTFLPAAGSSLAACATTAPTPAGTTVALPDGSTVWANGDATTQSGSAGIEGSHGYLYASGSAASGGTIQGSSTDTGANGYANIPPSSASDICVSP